MVVRVTCRWWILLSLLEPVCHQWIQLVLLWLEIKNFGSQVATVDILWVLFLAIDWASLTTADN